LRSENPAVYDARPGRVRVQNLGQPSWATRITNCWRYGDNTETNLRGNFENSFHSFAQPTSVRNAGFPMLCFNRHLVPSFFNQNNLKFSAMENARHLYEPHLAIKEFLISPGGEWRPESSGWSLLQIKDGIGYCLQTQGSTELEAGTIILTAGRAGGNIRASQLGKMSFYAFNVMPSRLTGLITLGEQELLDAACGRESAFRILPPENFHAVALKELYAGRKTDGLPFRLKLLQIFVGIVGGELEQASPARETVDARERLQKFLRRTTPDELSEMSFPELARNTHCTSRHLSRVFHELVGMSFRDKRAEIRMARARELLATSSSKVIEVAMESGFKSLSLFNLMFTRRFGTSPGRWRRKYAGDVKNKNNRIKKMRRFAL
jgi:AraC-like DNA-binding protein